MTLRLTGTPPTVISDGLTDGRVPYQSGGKLVDDADLTFDGTTLTAAALRASGLTSGRVPYVTTGGLLTNAAGFAFLTTGGGRLTVGDASGLANFTVSSNAATAAQVRLHQGGVPRWIFYASTGNAWALEAYDSGGTVIDTPISIANASAGAMTITRPLTLSTASDGLTIARTTGTTLVVSSTAATCATFGGGVTLGAGIKFPSTQVSSADANTLDDYEEGTWTPVISTGTGSVTVDASFDTCAYTKIGRMVFLTGEIRLSGVSTPTGAVTVSGLPFAVGNVSERGEYTSGLVRLVNITGTMNGPVFGDFSAGTSSFVLQAIDNGVAADIGANLTSTTRLTLGLFYFSD